MSLEDMIRNGMVPAPTPQLHVASPMNDKQLLGMMAAEIYTKTGNPAFAVTESMEILAQVIARFSIEDLGKRIEQIRASRNLTQDS